MNYLDQIVDFVVAGRPDVEDFGVMFPRELQPWIVYVSCPGSLCNIRVNLN